MQISKLIIQFLLVLSSLNVLAISGGLFPEDGSLAMKRWYYSGGKSGPRVAPLIINQIESAFRNEGIEPIVFSHYEWMQDILFIDQSGNFVELADFSVTSSNFDDLTLGVFENEGWASRLNKLSEDEFSPFENNFQKLNYTFLEGGASISGKFDNGDNYLIIYQERINRLIKANQEKYNNLSAQEIIERICLELHLKTDNLFLIPATAGGEHLDLYIKAMPGGVLIIDDPSMRVELISNLYEQTGNVEYKKILNFEQTDRYEYHKNFYAKKIQIVLDALKSRFKIFRYPGRFYNIDEMDYGISYKRELINFFNGVSGSEFYITNMATKTPELEELWAQFLQENFGISNNRVYFVGEYSDGAGLDCMGSPSP